MGHYDHERSETHHTDGNPPRKNLTRFAPWRSIRPMFALRRDPMWSVVI